MPTLTELPELEVIELEELEDDLPCESGPCRTLPTHAATHYCRLDYCGHITLGCEEARQRWLNSQKHYGTWSCVHCRTTGQVVVEIGPLGKGA